VCGSGGAALVYRINLQVRYVSSTGGAISGER